MKIGYGNLVEVKTRGKKYIGILMPRAEVVKGNYVVLKLENGYNIGIKRKEVKEIKLIRKIKRKKTIPKKIEFNGNLPTVSILSTGGTISCKVDYRTGGVYPALSASEIIENVPEISNFANIRTREIMRVPSEDMNPKMWRKMAKEVVTELNSNVSGVVITHGTDCMHYSSAMLAFMLKNLNKPVVFTGAQRSSDRGSSDAFQNLLCSIIAAANSKIAESMICMHANTDDNFNFLLRGVKARKMHTERRDAFRPINCFPLASVYPSGKIEYSGEKYIERNNKRVELDNKIEEKVALIYFYAGQKPEILDFYKSKGYKGIVIAGTGLGHVATSLKKYSWIPKIKEMTKKGIAIAMTSQCLYGRVHPFVYTPLRKLSMLANAIFCEDMLPEVAYCKLMWVLGKTKEMEKIKEMMLTNYVNEITKVTNPKTFLI